MRIAAETERMRKRGTRVETVYSDLMGKILSGALPGGTELNEVVLAQEMCVSRTPVHEALLRLAHDGLVENPINRTARVIRLTRQDILHLYEARKIVESGAVALATTRLPDRQLAALEEKATALADTMDQPDWAAQALAFDIQFHDVIAAGTGNPHLRSQIARYRLLVRSFCKLTGSVANLKQAFQEHREILKALQQRDSVAASALMTAHIEARLQVVLREIS